MANLANFLRSEISRIARKEIRSEIQALRKASTQYRSEIAALKRSSAEQQRLIAALRKQVAKASTAPETDESPRLRFRPAGFASLREKLGVSAADMGQLVGVSAQTIYHWEQGKSKPRAAQLESIAAVRKLGKRAVQARLAEEAA